MTTLQLALYLTDPPTETQIGLFYRWFQGRLL